jgi:hypothetical protein
MSDAFAGRWFARSLEEQNGRFDRIDAWNLARFAETAAGAWNVSPSSDTNRTAPRLNASSYVRRH